MSGCQLLQPPPPNSADNRSVFFFDVDNTLYRKVTGVGDLMQEYIRNYIESTLHLDEADADYLQKAYYKEYGLAIEGLVRKNHVDAMDYNAKVDDALPLQTCIKPDPRLYEMLSKIDRTKVKLWLCTNAYRNHGIRVIKLLGIEEFFEGITYCDYQKSPLICKPMPEFFEGAMKDVGVNFDGHKPDRTCYIVDDSELNVDAAAKMGWHSVRINEPDTKEEPKDMMATPLDPPLHEGGTPQMKYLLQLPLVYPEIFKK